MVPVYVISFNRLTLLASTVDQLRRFPDVRPVVVDNCSTYPPLLDYLGRVDAEVVRLDVHLGKNAPWLSGLAPGGDPYYAVTDPDLDLGGCPDDLFEVLRAGLDRYPWALKCGPSLEIDDLPSECPWTADVVAWEGQFWADRLDDRYFRAGIDTTLALYRRETPFDAATWTEAGLRCDRPYTARHLPWYATVVTDEDRYYVEHMACAEAHWTRRVYDATPGPGGEG